MLAVFRRDIPTTWLRKSPQRDDAGLVDHCAPTRVDAPA
jgi:hypothetical protein